jgi:hypothetical protein
VVEKPLYAVDLPQLRQQSALLAFYLAALDMTRQRMQTRVHRMKRRLGGSRRYPLNTRRN